MEYKNEITMIHDINIDDRNFQKAFREYFSEIGITLKENTDVFEEIKKSQETEGTQSLGIKQGEDFVGFVLYQVEPFVSSSGFFEQKVGFIREVWIKKNHRGQKLGTRLLEEVYRKLRDAGVKKVLLTYDEDAIGFYLKSGYEYDDSYTAKNKMRCIVKYLSEKN